MSHRAGCTFGPGFLRVELTDGSRRFCQTEDEVALLHKLLPPGSVRRYVRDGYCLDELEDASPDVIDADTFLAMPREAAMLALEVESEAEYTRAYRAVEDAVLARDRAGGGASIVIKRKGRRVLDAN
jgi:hypothetical protein